jgi:hypothetical protein
MKVFSFDAETNGLWGKAFAIAALVYEDGVETARFIGRCPLDGEPTEFVREQVLPQMESIEESHDSYETLLADFARFYQANKNEADIVVHMGVPVESRLLFDMHTLGFIGDWDGPYPLIDIAGCLKQAGEDPTSVDSYAAKYGVAATGMTLSAPECQAA